MEPVVPIPNDYVERNIKHIGISSSTIESDGQETR